MSPRTWWARLDGTVKAGFSLAAFAGLVAGAVRIADGYVAKSALADEFAKRDRIDEEQERDIDLQFETQVRLVTNVENLQREVREVRRDLRALDAGRPLPPLREETTVP